MEEGSKACRECYDIRTLQCRYAVPLLRISRTAAAARWLCPAHGGMNNPSIDKSPTPPIFNILCDEVPSVRSI